MKYILDLVNQEITDIQSSVDCCQNLDFLPDNPRELRNYVSSVVSNIAASCDFLEIYLRALRDYLNEIETNKIVCPDCGSHARSQNGVYLCEGKCGLIWRP